MVFGLGQLYILCCHGSWMYTIPATAKGKNIGTIAWVNFFVGCNLVKPGHDGGKSWANRENESKWLERAAVAAYKCQKSSWRCGVRYFPFSIVHVVWESFPCPLKNAVFQKEGLNIWELCVVRDRRKQHHRSGLIWKHALSLCVSGFLTFLLWEKLANPKQQEIDSCFLVPII